MTLAMNAKSSQHRSAARTMLPRQRSWAPTSPLLPFGVLKKCIEHPLTERGLVSFLNDWEKVANA